jgi:hypothetical protein
MSDSIGKTRATHEGEEKKKGVDEAARVVSNEVNTSRAAATICEKRKSRD